jgi:hypothetical protein
MNHFEPEPPDPHSPVAHDVLGFCAACPGWSKNAELIGWRTWAAKLVGGRIARRLLGRHPRPRQPGL